MAMTDVIPDEVLWRKDKEGFKMPEYEILKENKNFVNPLYLYNRYIKLGYLMDNLDFGIKRKGTPIRKGDLVISIDIKISIFIEDNYPLGKLLASIGTL